MNIAREKAAALSKSHLKSSSLQLESIDEKPPNKVQVSRSSTFSVNQPIQQKKISPMDLIIINDGNDSPVSTDYENDQSSQSSLQSPQSPPQTTMGTISSRSNENNSDYKYQSRHSQK